jgi:N-acetylmuramoyl-L-alanine amidase
MILRERPSPNHNERRRPVSMLVLHYTGMKTAAEAIDRLCDEAAEVSAHYVVEEDGTVWRLVDESRRAWHAGASFWRGETDLNSASIGVEIVNPGHEFGYRPFPAPQMRAVAELCRGILARHPIAPSGVVGHSDVAPRRKQDPGELFDWEGLARDGIGLWPDFSVDAPPIAPEEGLARIGYELDEVPATVVAFQRRWRQRLVDGVLDEETRHRIAAVAALLG